LAIPSRYVGDLLLRAAYSSAINTMSPNRDTKCILHLCIMLSGNIVL